VAKAFPDQARDFRFRRRHIAVIGDSDGNDAAGNVWETAATAAALAHCMIDLQRHDQPPRILSEKLGNCLLDLTARYYVATANDHRKTANGFI
jgi:hypothetical protein